MSNIMFFSQQILFEKAGRNSKTVYREASFNLTKTDAGIFLSI